MKNRSRTMLLCYATSPNQNQYLYILARQKPEMNAKELCLQLLFTTGATVSTQTVGNRLCQNNHRSRLPLWAPQLTSQQRAEPYRWFKILKIEIGSIGIAFF